MKLSQSFFYTLRENAKDEDSVSSNLLVRAGMIKKCSNGIYMIMPMGKKVLSKVENIIREEMDAKDAQELLMPALIPEDVYVQSGRREAFGSNMFSLSDRYNERYVLGPTHEELFAVASSMDGKSYKDFPYNLYQIQTKYRDEVRPRFGLMRGREFIMKDAYSFDKDDAGLEQSYKEMYATYQRIFNRLDLHYKVVLADTGAIGGSESHQFMALSEVGESNIIYCDHCHYAADEEKAESKAQSYRSDDLDQPLIEVETKDKKTIEEVSQYLQVSFKDVVKTMIYKTKEEFVAVLVRGDQEVNPIKVCNALKIAEHELQLATAQEITSIGSVEGFVGPVGLKIKIFVDEEVALMKNIIVGANKKDYHLKNVNYQRDFTGQIGYFRKSKEGDICPICRQIL